MMRRDRLGMSTFVLIFHFLRNIKRGLSPIVPLLSPIVPDQKFFLIRPDGTQQAKGDMLGERNGIAGAEAKAGAFAVLGGEDQAVVVKAQGDPTAIGPQTAGQGVFRGGGAACRSSPGSPGSSLSPERANKRRGGVSDERMVKSAETR